MNEAKIRIGKTVRAVSFIVICVLLSTLLFPFVVGAEETAKPALTVESKTVHRGQTFGLSINLDENPGLVAMLLMLDYDETAMKLINVVQGDGLSGLTFTTTNTDTAEGYSIRPFRLLWDGTRQESTTGNLVTLIFESNVSAEMKDYPVTLTYSPENTNREIGQPIPLEIHNGTVTLTGGEYNAIYKNYDGSVLMSRDYNGNELPLYNGATPVRAEDECYSYEFDGWQGTVSEDPNTLVYTAKYKETPKIYQAFFYIDGEYYAAKALGYGSLLTDETPYKKNHSFIGWFTDAEMTELYEGNKMPPYDLTLYGYFRFDIRENPIPKLRLDTVSTENGIATVEVNIVENPGLAGMVLTLDYDRDGLTFCGFENGEALAELQFDKTNTDDLTKTPFKFYWEGAHNVTNLGTLLTLRFKINENATPGNYGVSFVYDPTSDITYFGEGEVPELLYSDIEIIGAQVPIGKIYEWTEVFGEENEIINVISEIGMTPDVVLAVSVVTESTDIPEETVKSVAGNNMHLTEAYTIELLRNGAHIEPDGMLTVKIKLNAEQLKCKKLALFFVDNEGNMTLHESTRDGDFLVFRTDHLSCWAIIGDEYRSVLAGTVTMERILLSLLAIICISFILILIARLRKERKNHSEPQRITKEGVKHNAE